MMEYNCGYRRTPFSCAAGLAMLMLLAAAPEACAERANFARAEKAFLEGRYDAAVHEAESLISANTGQKDELYYLKGVSQLKLGKFADSRASFDYIIKKYSWSKKLFDAYLGKGDSYLLAGDAGNALGVYNEMAVRFQGDRNMAIVHQRMSACYARLGLKDKAALYAAKAQSEAPLSFESRSVPQASAVPPAQAAPAAVRPADTVRQPDAAPPKAASAGTDDRFSVQVGVFKNKRNADRLARNLARAGYEARVEIPVAAQDKLYKVKIGRLATKAEADDLASRLIRAGYKTRIAGAGE